jgi:hypothetical protein
MPRTQWLNRYCGPGIALHVESDHGKNFAVQSQAFLEL